jgi:hypothetical protein
VGSSSSSNAQSPKLNQMVHQKPVELIKLGSKEIIIDHIFSDSPMIGSKGNSNHITLNIYSLLDVLLNFFS